MAASKFDDLEQAMQTGPGNADLRHLLGAQYAPKPGNTNGLHGSFWQPRN